jgi:restriction modification system DNA specificity domain protein
VGLSPPIYDNNVGLKPTLRGATKNTMKNNRTFLENLLDGAEVEWKPLMDLAEIGTGNSNRQDEEENGKYPFYVRSKNILRANSFQFDETAIIIPGEGGIGDIFHYVEGKYALHQRAYRIHITSDEINPKFLYYIMHNSFKKYILSKSVGATAISIRKPMLEKFEIPIPPLPVQTEIVKILDALAALSSELTSELILRWKQYEYYREKLLSEEKLEKSGGDWKYLTQVANLTRGRVISKGYISDNVGDYPVYSSQTVNNGEIGKINSFDFNGEFVSWTTDGANAGTVFYRSGKFSITNVCGLIKIKNSSELNYKFLFYWLSIEAKKHVYSGMGNPKLMSHQMEKIKIPIPPLSVQTKIVKILDKFETLTNSITEGLPLAIEQSQKRYEYYRELLLNFPGRE